MLIDFLLFLWGAFRFKCVYSIDIVYVNMVLFDAQAVEVLWTPQDQNDTLSEREILRDYPLLRSL